MRFAETAEGVAAVTKRKLEVDEATALAEAAHVERRRRLIDDTDAATRRENLKQVSPWIPMFTPGESSFTKRVDLLYMYMRIIEERSSMLWK